MSPGSGERRISRMPKLSPVPPGILVSNVKVSLAAAQPEPSKTEPDLPRHRPPDDVAERVLLHGFIEQVGATYGYRQEAVGRVNPEGTIDEGVRRGEALVWRQDILPESGIHEAP